MYKLGKIYNEIKLFNKVTAKMVLDLNQALWEKSLFSIVFRTKYSKIYKEMYYPLFQEGGGYEDEKNFKNMGEYIKYLEKNNNKKLFNLYKELLKIKDRFDQVN